MPGAGKHHYLANQVVRDLDDLDRRIHAAVATINGNRRLDSLPEFRDAA